MYVLPAFFVSNCYSQSSELKLIAEKTIFKLEDEWRNYDSIHYLYNTNDLVQEKTEFYLGDESLINKTKTKYTYDDNNYLVDETKQDWINGKWENTVKNEFKYNTTGEQISEIILVWELNEWVNQLKHETRILTPDFVELIMFKGNETGWDTVGRTLDFYSLEKHTFEWDIWSNGWIKNIRIEDYYNNDELLDSISQYSYIGTKWKYLAKEYFYYSDELLDSSQIYVLDDLEWQIKSSQHFSYNNNSIEERSFNYNDGSIEKDKILIKTFDALNNLIRLTILHGEDNEWENIQHIEFNYLDNLIRDTKTSLWLDNQWLHNHTRFYFYDELSSNYSSSVKNENIVLYPNPCSLFFKVQFKPIYEKKNTLEIFNSAGHLIHVENNIKVDDSIDITSKKISEGIYFIKFNVNTKTICSRIAIKH